MSSGLDKKTGSKIWIFTEQAQPTFENQAL